ncbi:GGDEF domain-containing protein [Oleiagrimonas soli]|uniref:diguanylate cyclase n=1 Tax=Oleiagrimonas soli TaxID=1543381 RepID=A0A841KNZ3_9GAMM|nr:GGDEF domain-containing protein [Oleiagrimonas soli]MBB6184381.1 diguanylate cyclase (GGDEF)-like protein [Oleiagrimonas soli]
MRLERHLRRWSVGQRVAVIVALLLLPLAILSAVSMTVLNEQGEAFRASVEESVHTLLPLTTLEHYLQRALVDELLAESHQAAPDFAGLTDSIDKSFSSLRVGTYSQDLPQDVMNDAHLAWMHAKPGVQRLVEQVRSVHAVVPQDGTDYTRQELERAIQDVSTARQHLSAVIEARYERAAAQRHRQLVGLVWGWVLTLTVAIVLAGAFLYSLVRPMRQLAQAAREIGNGRTGVRVPVEGQDELTALAACFNDMAASWETTRQTLVTEATEDPLTGTLNRRATLALLTAELEAGLRAHQPFSLLVLDLDRFKSINDRFGHAAGDRALCWVVDKVRGLLREGDHLGRYGGDEFIVLLPRTGKAQAERIAQRIVQAVGEAAVREPAYPGVSVGVATAPDAGRDATALVEAADAALYKHKQRHRAP